MKDGDLIKKERYYYPGHDFTKKFNTDGFITEETTHFPIGFEYYKYSQYSYNEEKQLISILYLNKDKSISSKSTYNYAENGSLESILNLDDEGNIIQYHKLLCDSKLRITKHEVLNKDNNLLAIITNEYTAKGKLDYSHHTNKYDSTEYSYKYEYDKIGNKIAEIMLNPIQDTISINSYEYKYDVMDNWIEMVLIENQTPKYLIERTIKYN